MRYGERLKIAMEWRESQLQRKIGRLELANAVGVTRHNIGLILNGSQGDDQKLKSDSHAKAAAFLKVNPDWLLNEVGKMEQVQAANAPKELSAAAIELAVLLDMIPQDDKIRRARAFNSASTAILKELRYVIAIDPSVPHSEK